MQKIQPLTKRQREVLDVIGRSIRAKGIAPSLEEIAASLNLSALATVHKHLEHLRMKGYIRRRFGHSRAIELIVGPGCCPVCGREFEAKVDVDFAMKQQSESVELKAVEKGLAGPIPT